MICDYKIKADNVDVTSTIKEHLLSLTLTDETGITSDSVKISLEDSGYKLKIPKKGVKLAVSIGYTGNLIPKGSFNVDTPTLSGPPPKMNITARGANFSKSLREPKTRSWHEVEFYDILQTIAKEHNLQPKMSQDLKNLFIVHEDQTEESDIHLLTRLAKDADAVAKPNGSFLMIIKSADAKTASGKALPTINIAGNEISSWSGSLPDRDKYKSVIAVWIDKKAAAEKEVTAGSGTPAWRLRKKFKTKTEAYTAATAALSKLNRRNAKFSFTMPGKPEVCAESPLAISEFREGFNGNWIVKKATHTINNSGYKTSVECQPPRGV